MSDGEKKVLLVRMDRIGDLCLNLSCDQTTPLENSQKTWLISQGLGFLCQQAKPQRNFIEATRNFSPLHFFKLFQIIKSEKYDLAIVFHAPWWISLLLFIARVPLRVGRYSQWHSFLFFNHGVRQKRSRAEKHEAEYNFEIIKELDSSFSSEEYKENYLELSSKDTKVLDKLNLQEKQYVVIHPGMGGSALNWPTQHYIKLIEALSLKTKVVITGTEIDMPYVQPIKEFLHQKENIIFADQILSIQEMLDLLFNTAACLAPSTGVVHLSAALGTNTIGLYSPITTEQERRWGPLGASVFCFSPDVEIKDEHAYGVMSKISVTDVLQKIESYL